MKYFLLAFSVSKSIGNNIFFYYQLTYRWIKNYGRKIHRRRLSVGDFVGNFFYQRNGSANTDGKFHR
jgi:hypothetical protein